jgi:uncharacterized membrane protein YhaH (DUF805 family)
VSITPSRCQGCGASLDSVQAGAVCPYCGRNNTAAGSASASAPASAAQPPAAFSAVTEASSDINSKPSWFELCVHYFNRAISRFARFSGRASRAEYWYFFLAVLLINVALALLGLLFPESALGDLIDLLSSVFLLFVLIPSVSIGVRRLHDVNNSGWWYLLILVPLVGPLVLLYWAIKPGDAYSNAYGEPEV